MQVSFLCSQEGRGASIGSTCLLSIPGHHHQPWASRWAELKWKLQAHWVFCFLGLDFGNAGKYHFSMYVSGRWGNTNSTGTKDLGCCSGVGNSEITPSLQAACCHSLTWVLRAHARGQQLHGSILYRHKQGVHHTHSDGLPPRGSPESTATQTVLVLVGTFVPFYTCTALVNNPGWWVVSICASLSSRFPTGRPLCSCVTTPQCPGSVLSA